ncbi:hypothetical protein [Streptomyces sp. 2A115]|uniref:hypothetical protein n=1 Tax=Streptomyces sp. 2A115 TaxID=3457439 RepID=UPI003FCFD64D
MNAGLDCYLVPAHADVPRIEVDWLDDPESTVPLGLVGLSEVGGAATVREFISGDADRTNLPFDGERAVNSHSTTVATATDFCSLTPPESFERNRDGTPRHRCFLHSARHSPPNTAGTEGSPIGVLLARH